MRADKTDENVAAMICLVAAVIIHDECQQALAGPTPVSSMASPGSARMDEILPRNA
jgi:hypothetical protein